MLLLHVITITGASRSPPTALLTLATAPRVPSTNLHQPPFHVPIVFPRTSTADAMRRSIRTALRTIFTLAPPRSPLTRPSLLPCIISCLAHQLARSHASDSRRLPLMSACVRLRPVKLYVLSLDQITVLILPGTQSRMMHEDILVWPIAGTTGDESIAVLVVKPLHASVRSTGNLCRCGTLLGTVTHPVGDYARQALSLFNQGFQATSR